MASMLIEAHEPGVHIPSTIIYEKIKKMGYTGSLRWMQEIMQKHSLRDRVKEDELLIRFETEPGQQ